MHIGNGSALILELNIQYEHLTREVGTIGAEAVYSFNRSDDHDDAQS